MGERLKRFGSNPRSMERKRHADREYTQTENDRVKVK